MTEPSAPAAPPIREIAAEVLRAIAKALYVAAAVIFSLMVVVFMRTSSQTGQSDWPGRYWFALLPTLAAAVTLTVSARQVENWAPLTRAKTRYDDWYT